MWVIFCSKSTKASMRLINAKFMLVVTSVGIGETEIREGY